MKLFCKVRRHMLLYPSPVTNCHTSSDPLPLEYDVVYGRHEAFQQLSPLYVYNQRAIIDVSLSPDLRLLRSQVYLYRRDVILQFEADSKLYADSVNSLTAVGS